MQDSVSEKLESRSKDDLILIIKSQLKKVKQCKVECAQANQQLVELRTQLNEVTPECGNTVLSLELFDSKKTIEALRKDCSVKDDELAEQGAVISRLTSELQACVLTNSQLKTELNSVLDASDEQKLQLNELKKELSLNADKAALATSKEELIQKLEREKNEMAIMLEQQKKGSMQSAEEIHRLKQDIICLSNENKALEDEYMDYRDKTDLLIQSKTSGMEDVVTIRKEFNIMKGQLDVCHAQLDAEIQKSSILNDEILSKQRYYNSLKEEHEKVQRQLEANISELRTNFRLKEHEQETTIKELYSELEGLRYNYSLKEAEFEEREQQRLNELKLLTEKMMEPTATTNPEIDVEPDFSDKPSASQNDHTQPNSKIRRFPDPLNFDAQPQFDFDESLKSANVGDRNEMLQSLHDLLAANEPLSRSESPMAHRETDVERDLLYTRELLQETEEINVKLHEQNQLLKSEIRRQSAEKAMENKVLPNMEYFKQIVLHFITSSSIHTAGQDIRKQLLPVLSEMLCLTQDERSNVERGINQGPASASPETSNYFGSLSDIL